jgi:hypothetical protein
MLEKEIVAFQFVGNVETESINSRSGISKSSYSGSNLEKWFRYCRINGFERIKRGFGASADLSVMGIFQQWHKAKTSIHDLSNASLAQNHSMLATAMLSR